MNIGYFVRGTQLPFSTGERDPDRERDRLPAPAAE